MNRSYPLILLSCLISFAPAQESQAPAIRTGIKEQIQKITAVLVDYDAKLDGNNKQIAEISQRADLSDADRKKIDQLVDSSEKAKLEILSIRSNLEEVRAALAGQGDDIGELKKSLERLMTERGKLEAIKATAEQLGNAPDEFKWFTSMESRNFPTEAVVELEAKKEGKEIPLSNKKVSVSQQFKDGPLKPYLEVRSDPDGVVRVAKPSVKGKLSPIYLVFEFAGDSSNRACQTRIKIR